MCRWEVTATMWRRWTLTQRGRQWAGFSMTRQWRWLMKRSPLPLSLDQRHEVHHHLRQPDWSRPLKPQNAGGGAMHTDCSLINTSPATWSETTMGRAALCRRSNWEWWASLQAIWIPRRVCRKIRRVRWLATASQPLQWLACWWGWSWALRIVPGATSLWRFGMFGRQRKRRSRLKIVHGKSASPQWPLACRGRWACASRCCRRQFCWSGPGSIPKGGWRMRRPWHTCWRGMALTEVLKSVSTLGTPFSVGELCRQSVDPSHWVWRVLLSYEWKEKRATYQHPGACGHFGPSSTPGTRCEEPR